MSYELAGRPANRRPHYRPARAARAGNLPVARPTVFHMPIQGGAGNVVRPIVRQPAYGALQSAYGIGDYDQLGFSLRPPRWLRKMQPGKILARAALPLAAVGGALLIPGVAPAAAGFLRGAGTLAARGASGIFTVAKAGARGLVSLVRQPVAKPSTASALYRLTHPTAAPVPTILPSAAPVTPITYAGQPDFSMMLPTGGGGGAAAPAEEAPSETAPAPNMTPWIIGGIAAVALLFTMRRSR